MPFRPLIMGKIIGAGGTSSRYIAWVRVPLCYRDDFPVVDAESKGFVFLGDDHYGCGPFRLCGVDDTLDEDVVNFSILEFALYQASSVKIQVYWGCSLF